MHTRKFRVLFFYSFLAFFCGTALSFSAYAEEATTKKVEKAKPQANPKVLMKTDLGDMTIELFAKKAPVTVENFLAYIDQGFYDGTIFHRVIPGFVVQGGGFRFDFSKKETMKPIVNESSPELKNLVGTLSMARLPSPDSATSQFFINLVDNESLDIGKGSAGYAVFGKIVSGIEVLRKIEQEPQGLFKRNPTFTNTPNIKPRIIKITRL